MTAYVYIAERSALSKRVDPDNMAAGRLNNRKDGITMRRRDFVKMTLAGAAAAGAIKFLFSRPVFC
jgi:hypothetical protein